jgi:hypothetical protein
MGIALPTTSSYATLRPAEKLAGDELRKGTASEAAENSIANGFEGAQL